MSGVVCEIAWGLISILPTQHVKTEHEELLREVSMGQAWNGTHHFLSGFTS